MSDTASEAHASSGRIIRGSTLIKIAMLAVALVAFTVLNTLAYDEVLPEAVSSAVYIGGIALIGIAAAIIISVAISIGTGESVGRQWLLIGLAAAAFAAGDVIWMYIELVLEQDPYPSAADMVYPLQYIFFFAAMLIAIRGYRGLVDLRRPVALGAVVAVLGTVTVYLTVLRPYIFASGVEELGLTGLIVSTAYPVGDVVLMLGPAVTIALLITNLGVGRLAWPWWLVVVGALLFAVTDSYYAYADWSEIGVTALIDAGWIGAQMVFASAALVARDVYRS